MSRLALLVVAVILLVSSFAVADRDAAPKNVILIGWDAAQRNHIREDMAKGELPTLSKLASEGTIVEIDILRTTDTKAGWTQILTGYIPEITGVFDNAEFQPIPEGYTIFERLEKYFGPDKIATVAVISKFGNVGDAAPKKVRVPASESQPAGKARTPTQDAIQKARNANIVVENGISYRVTPGEPYYITKDHMDVFINGLGADANVGNKAMEMLEKYKNQRFFFFVHFGMIDARGHAFGENSKQEDAAYVNTDLWTGKIIAKLKELGLYDDTLVYVTADHGFDEGKRNHKDAPYVFLATNDPKVMRRGERADITPTILDRFGVDLSTIDPPLSGHSLLKPYNPSVWTK